MSMRPSLRAVFVIAAVATATSAPAAPAPASAAHPFRPADLARIRDVSDPRVSPDGAWVAYVVEAANTEDDRLVSDLWMVSWDGSTTLQLTHTPKQSESHPRWSPDGRFLAFLAARGGADAKDQVWLLDRRGGEARPLTSLPGGVSDFAWSPDGTRLALIASDPDPEEAAGEGQTKRPPKPIVIDRYAFEQDRVGYLRHLREHLYVFDLGSRKAELLLPGDFDEALPAWSPDGSRIAFVSKREGDPDRNENWDVWVIDARAGAVPRRLTSFEGADDDPAWDSPPAWSPDGSEIAYLQFGPPKYRDYDPPQLAVIGASGGSSRLLTGELDRAVTRPFWSPDGRSLLFLLEDDRSQQLARVPASGGPVKRLTPAGRVVSAPASGPDGRIALLSSRSQVPAEVFVLEKGALRPLSHQNQPILVSLKLGATTGIAFESGGVDVHGLLTTPPGLQPGRRYPAIVYIHGGPVAQDGFEFDAIRETLAGAGYLVIQPNYRGSSGRGRDFSRAIYADWGDLEVKDVLAAVDDVVGEGQADPERLGIGGWSYGGMTTNYTIASDGRFKAAVSGAGISNMLTGYGTDQYVRQYESELGLPWKGIEPYLKVSYPFFHNDRIRTPTLFLCGEKDMNVPLINSEQMYQALRSRNVPTELVIYPGEFHGLRRVSFRRDRLERYLAWYDAHLRPAGAREP